MLHSFKARITVCDEHFRRTDLRQRDNRGEPDCGRIYLAANAAVHGAGGGTGCEGLRQHRVGRCVGSGYRYHGGMCVSSLSRFPLEELICLIILVHSYFYLPYVLPSGRIPGALLQGWKTSSHIRSVNVYLHSEMSHTGRTRGSSRKSWSGYPILLLRDYVSYSAAPRTPLLTICVSPSKYACLQ